MVGFVSLGVLFPEFVQRVCHFRTTGKGIPDEEYAVLESYCVEPGCDCELVLLNVVRRGSDRIVATVCHDLTRKSEPTLDPLHAQSRHAAAALVVVSAILADGEYSDQLAEHYDLVQRAVADETDPIHDRIRSERASWSLTFRLVTFVLWLVVVLLWLVLSPVRRLLRRRGEGTAEHARERAGRNDPCPCGSGKKHKRCCLGASVSGGAP